MFPNGFLSLKVNKNLTQSGHCLTLVPSSPIIFFDHSLYPSHPLFHTHRPSWVLTQASSSRPQDLCACSFLCGTQIFPWLLPPCNSNHNANVTSSEMPSLTILVKAALSSSHYSLCTKLFYFPLFLSESILLTFLLLVSPNYVTMYVSTMKVRICQSCSQLYPSAQNITWHAEDSQ